MVEASASSAPLRHALDMNYPSIRASAARSLLRPTDEPSLLVPIVGPERRCGQPRSVVEISDRVGGP